MTDLAQNLILDSVVAATVNKSNFDSQIEIFNSFDNNFFDNFPFDLLSKLG